MSVQIGADYLIGMVDMMSSASVALFVKKSMARLRRQAAGENWTVVLPGYFYDFFNLALQYNPGINQLPVMFSINDSNNVVPMIANSYTHPEFKTVDHVSPMGMALNPYIGVRGDAFAQNQYTFNFAPIISDANSTHSYTLFNELMHRAIIQPGILLLPVIYKKSNSMLLERTYGPLLIESAQISGEANGSVSISINLTGGTCMSATWNLGTDSSKRQELLTPGRKAGLADTVILIGDDANQYFDIYDLFEESVFELAYGDGSLIYNSADLNNDKKRITSWTLNINNSWKFTQTMPSNTWSGFGTSQISDAFTSNDSAGVRYAVLQNRKVHGSIEFASERISAFDEDYLNDNYQGLTSATKKMIISIAPNFHFPLTNVQFSIGQPTYSAEKVVRTKYTFVSRVSDKVSMSQLGQMYSNPTSEFGYTYNINNNRLIGSTGL